MAAKKTGLTLPLPLQFLAAWLAVCFGRRSQCHVRRWKGRAPGTSRRSSQLLLPRGRVKSVRISIKGDAIEFRHTTPTAVALPIARSDTIGTPRTHADCSCGSFLHQAFSLRTSRRAFG